jgi:hypothetical protein
MGVNMSNTSIVPLRPKARMVVLHEDLVAICEGDHCRSAILRLLIYWTDIKIQTFKRRKGREDPNGLWIFKKQEDFAREILDLYGTDKIAASLRWLVSRGYIEIRRNPRFGWDRTKQYLLRADIVQEALRTSVPTAESELESRTSQVTKTDKSVFSTSESREAIPETTHQTTTETYVATDHDGQRDYIDSGTNKVPTRSSNSSQSDSTTPQQITSNGANAGKSAYDIGGSGPDKKESVYGERTEDAIKFVMKAYPRNHLGLGATEDAARRAIMSLESMETAEKFMRGVKTMWKVVKHGDMERKYVPSFARFAGLNPKSMEEPLWHQWSERQEIKKRPTLEGVI